MSDLVELSVSNSIAEVVFNRPEKLNALNSEMFGAIIEVIDRLSHMAEVRVVLLYGKGRAFCAGLDLSAMADGGSGFDLGRRDHGLANAVQQVAWGWRTLRVPVIAAVHGVAFGGGIQIAAGADVRLCHPDTKLSIREVWWGLVPDMAGTALWRGLVREDVLRELTYTSQQFSGAEAEKFGFVTRLADDPLAEARTLCTEIAARSPDAVQAAKRLYNHAAGADVSAQLVAETTEQMRLKATTNHTEAVSAGIEKRAARFTDPDI